VHRVREDVQAGDAAELMRAQHLENAAEQARRDKREYTRMRLSHDAVFDDARAAVHGNSQVQVSPHLQGMIDRVAAMTDDVHANLHQPSL